MSDTKERPILFSGAMVRALLAGTKTQTRRVVKPQPANGWAFEAPPVFGRITSPHPKRGKFGAFIRRGLDTDFPETDLIVCPYGMPGDRLWVRESWRPRIIHSCGLDACDCESVGVTYRADGAWQGFGFQMHRPIPEEWLMPQAAQRGDVPSIHMPRWASRILLEVVSVRVERLQDISEADAQAEGCDQLTWNGIHGTAADLIDWPLKTVNRPWANGYALLWESINGDGSWAANPLVWAVEFKVVA